MRLLLIEDNPDDVAIVERLARSSPLPVEVTAHSNGVEALEWLARAEVPPDLVLLDIGLPGTRGTDILKRIKEDDELSEIPVIVVSGSRDDEDILEGVRLGAHSHIVKPIRNCDFAWIVVSVMKAQPRRLALRSMQGRR